jgi:hypothetical protein
MKLSRKVSSDDNIIGGAGVRIFCLFLLIVCVSLFFGGHSVCESNQYATGLKNN